MKWEIKNEINLPKNEINDDKLKKILSENDYDKGSYLNYYLN